MSIGDNIFSLLDKGITVAGEVQKAKASTNTSRTNAQPEKSVESTDAGQLAGVQAPTTPDLSGLWKNPAVIAAGVLVVGIVALQVLK